MDYEDVAPYKTGNLKTDIQIFDDAISQGKVVVGNSKLAHYAPYVHQGTGKQAKGKSKAPHKKGMKAKPYLEVGMENYLKSSGLGEKIKKSFRNVTIK